MRKVMLNMTEDYKYEKIISLIDRLLSSQNAQRREFL